MDAFQVRATLFLLHNDRVQPAVSDFFGDLSRMNLSVVERSQDSLSDTQQNGQSEGLVRPSVAELFRFIEIGLRPSIFAQFMICDSTVVVRSRITGVQKNRFVEIADRVVVLIFVIAGHATVVVGSGLSGIQKDRPVEIADCLIVLIFVIVGQAAVVVRRSISKVIVGVQLDRLGVLADRMIVVAFFVEI